MNLQYINKDYPYTFIGVLPSYDSILKDESVEECYKSKGRVFFNQYGELQFVLKVINEIPDFIKSEYDSVYFTAYGNSILEWNDNINNSLEKRIEEFTAFLEKKLILFKLYISSKEHHRFKVSSTNSCILKDMPEGINKESKVLLIPQYEKSQIDLEKRIVNKSNLDLSNFIENSKEYAPIIINKNTIYGSFKQIKLTSRGYECLQEGEIKKIRLDLESDIIKNHSILHDGLRYIEKNFLYSILIGDWLNEGEVVTGLIETPLLDDNESEYSSNERYEFERVKESEEDFLINLKNKALSEHLVYSEEDLINFHTAIKTGNLVILSGVSGTGKSKLVEIYAKSLGIYNKDQYLMIPVKPNWNDDSDLIGFLDTINNVYRPSSTGLVDLLIQADESREKDKIFLVCFDEMNLSRVEYYFSEFLSILEQDASRRKLTIYNPNIESRVFNSNIYKSEIHIGPNVIFVGTINTDETTFSLSDKVLDRATVIKSDIGSFRTWKETANSQEHIDSNSILKQEDFFKWINNSNKVILKDRELDFLQKFNEYLNQINPAIGVGYRVLYQINRYISNIPEGKIERQYSFDLQVVQKVLPKLRGSSDVLEQFIGKDKKINKLIEEYIDVSKFEKSKKVLEIKQKEMEEHGFVC